MDITKLTGLNDELDNVINVPFPYWFIAAENDEPAIEEHKRMVVFFGNDMAGILGFGIAEKESYISRVNGCLSYIRKNFQGFDLCYKAHPGDDSEQSLLNLTGFRIIHDKEIAEIYLAKNLRKVRAVFTVGSFSAFNGYNMGIDSHVFYHCFPDVYGADFLTSLDTAFFEMPQSFFIRNFDQELVDNARELKKDGLLESVLAEVLARHHGTVWFYCSFSESIVTLSILSCLIKKLSPARRVCLMVSHHRRWDRLADFLNDHFDETVFMPRIHYSLKPARLLHAIRVARRVKSLSIVPGDILMIASQPDFVENCLTSYFKKNLRIGLTTSRDIYAQYDPQSSTYTSGYSFHFNKATWFYNIIFEPLLGLHRSLYMSFTEMTRFYFNRYQKPLNEVFDRLIIFCAAVRGSKH